MTYMLRDIMVKTINKIPVRWVILSERWKCTRESKGNDRNPKHININEDTISSLIHN